MRIFVSRVSPANRHQNQGNCECVRGSLSIFSFHYRGQRNQLGSTATIACTWGQWVSSYGWGGHLSSGVLHISKWQIVLGTGAWTSKEWRVQILLGRLAGYHARAGCCCHSLALDHAGFSMFCRSLVWKIGVKTVRKPLLGSWYENGPHAQNRMLHLNSSHRKGPEQGRWCLCHHYFVARASYFPSLPGTRGSIIKEVQISPSGDRLCGGMNAEVLGRSTRADSTKIIIDLIAAISCTLFPYSLSAWLLKIGRCYQFLDKKNS